MQGESESSLDGLHVAISGLGKVGFDLSKLLYDEGVRLTVADIDNRAVIRAFRDIDAADVESDVCHEVYCDIFSPCALGNIINKNTRESLQCTAIVGAANNQLDNEDTADWLRKNNIVYAPDYLVNSGGVIAVAFEITDNIENIQNQVLEIYDRTYDILEMSKKESLSTYVAAKNIAMNRINSV